MGLGTSDSMKELRSILDFVADPSFGYVEVRWKWDETEANPLESQVGGQIHWKVKHTVAEVRLLEPIACPNPQDTVDALV